MTIDEVARKRRHRNERIAATVLVTVLLIALVIFVRWNREEEKELAKAKTYVPKVTPVSAEIALLREYVRIDTSNPPGTNQLAGARWLSKILQSEGVAVELIESGPGRANVYARIRGRNRGDGLLLLHHIDVVPVHPKQWEHPPFGGEIKLDMLYGRGTLDMKGIGICHLRAFLDVAKSKRAPEHDLVFLAVVDEETGSAGGVPWLLEHRPDVFEGIRYALNEGGITELVGEKVLYFGIEIGAKNETIVDVAAPRIEQLQAMRIGLEPYFVRREPQRVLPEVRRLFREQAQTRMQYGTLLADIDKTIAAGDFWRLPPGYRELTQNDLGVDVARASGDHFLATVRLMNLPDQDPDERLRWLEKTIAPFGVRVATVRQKQPATPLSSPETPLFSLIAREARREYGSPAGTEILFKEQNDSRFLRARGMTCYGLWPFPVDVFQTQSIHQSNERVRLDWFDQGVRLTRRVVALWAYPAPPN
ncbi:MAG TPA: M20/M25/M40 family metallo-hydrolase [Thermoanaerobaculia bacterium]|nr:M20/M25/M40 family metallo-hydrolase [Thermoanaerobaculia bacterium]